MAKPLVLLQEPEHLPADLTDAVQKRLPAGRKGIRGWPVDRAIPLLDGARANVRHLSPPAELHSVAGKPVQQPGAFRAAVASGRAAGVRVRSAR